MQLEVGGIYEGKVTGITKFGAFVSFENGQTGMVHISEVAAAFVKEIKDFLSDGQEVKVKVIGISDDGKVSLSIKKALPPEQQTSQHENKRDFQRRGNNQGGSPNRGGYNQRRSSPPQPPVTRPGDFEWQSKENNSGSFEDMLSRFKQTSDEKISDLKKGTETKRGYSRRGTGNK
ncbi:S1 RNA-binding domain-containing protein [Scatolibacter rhodanostii]|uniref:S1 RNA-binding domain-containing protein n=1 Tax=Scatolibacter rhodanostii TaxID=2014781 RepID=UPI000C079D42|nr:S1 RNA-binding domain-containing protein [Scatolibacter rhodanostii]